jgi:hypothetical protein
MRLSRAVLFATLTFGTMSCEDGSGKEPADSDPGPGADSDSDSDSDADSDNDTDLTSGGGACACDDPGVTLTAISGCESFGGDEEQCSGWASCESENGLETNSAHSDGTELTCFGCTIRITCP